MKLLMTILIVNASLISYAGNGIITIEEDLGSCFGPQTHRIVVYKDETILKMYTIGPDLNYCDTLSLTKRMSISSVDEVLSTYLIGGYVIKNIDRSRVNNTKYILVRRS